MVLIILLKYEGKRKKEKKKKKEMTRSGKKGKRKSINRKRINQITAIVTSKNQPFSSGDEKENKK